MELDIIYNEDCLIGLNKIPDLSIDMIFCDLPYGTTHNEWDNKIPLNDYVLLDGKFYCEDDYMLYQYKKGIDYPTSRLFFDTHKQPGLWTLFHRIIKPNGVIALWGQDKYAHELVQSNYQYFRYEWIIEKSKGTGHLNARKMPLKCHESVLIFYKHLPPYHPQKTTGHTPVHNYTKHTSDGSNYGKGKLGISGGGSTERYPRDVLKFKWDTQKSHLHPTQKPIEACKYFILTYTNKGNIILDATAGSCTTAVAAKKLNRHFICFEKNTAMYEIGISRLEKELSIV